MNTPRSAASRNLEHYKTVHQEDANYGRSSRRIKRLIADSIKAGIQDNPGWSPKTILDFGCGKSDAVDFVAGQLGMKSYRYDPAMPGLSTLPVQSADVVMNTDVLEHLDKSEVELLLADVRGLTKTAFFNIATAPAGKILPSGENAHATVEPPEWWADRINEHFGQVTSLPAAPNRASFVTWTLSPKSLRRIEARFLLQRKQYRAALVRWLGLD